VGLALLALHEPVALRKDLLRLLSEDPSARVRATLAAALSRRRATTKLTAELAAALHRLAASDPSELVRNAAALTVPAVTAESPQWRIFALVDADANDAPVRQQPYFLQGSDGVVRAMYTDANGEITSERLPAASVLLPASREADF
jgi:hypothetical protein